MPSDNKLFIVGSVRSGTTMFKLMFHHHPDLINPGEFDFFFDRVGDRGEIPDMDAYRSFLSGDRIFREKNFKVDPALDFKALLESFYAQIESKGEHAILNLHRNYHRVQYIYPDAKYIHVVRDPRDVARSTVPMGFAGHAYYGVELWTETEVSWDQLKANLKEENYLEVRYETFLEDPIAGLKEICAFVGVEYTDQMLSYADNSNYELPDVSLAYQWKRKADPKDISYLEYKIKDQLLERGYELSEAGPKKPGLFAKLKLLWAHRSKRFTMGAKRYGAGLYVTYLLVKRFGTQKMKADYQLKIDTISNQGLR